MFRSAHLSATGSLHMLRAAESSCPRGGRRQRLAAATAPRGSALGVRGLEGIIEGPGLQQYLVGLQKSELVGWLVVGCCEYS